MLREKKAIRKQKHVYIYMYLNYHISASMQIKATKIIYYIILREKLIDIFMTILSKSHYFFKEQYYSKTQVYHSFWRKNIKKESDESARLKYSLWQFNVWKITIVCTKKAKWKKRSIYFIPNSIQNLKFRNRIQIAKHITCPEKYFTIIFLDLLVYHGLNCSDYAMYMYVKPIFSSQIK